MRTGWQISTLGETCEMYQPKTITGKELIEGGAYPVYGANGVIGRYNQFNHEEPQLLITCRGATCGAVNVSAPKAWITGNAMVVRPKSEAVSLRFLEYLFRGGIDISLAITGAAQPQITRANLAPLEIAFPTSTDEQQRIVTILDQAFAAIATAKANTEKNLANARALFQSHLHAVFERGDRSGDDQGVGVNWESSRLDSLCTAFADGDWIESKDQSDSGIRLIQTGNVGEGDFKGRETKARYISEETFKRLRCTEIFAGDCLVSRLPDPVGRSCILPAIGERMITAVDCTIVRFDQKRMLPQFFCAFTQSDNYLSAIDRETSGTTRKRISRSKLGEMQIPVPPLAEQQRIVTFLDQVSSNTRRLETAYQKKLSALDALKKSLLHQAFTGQLTSKQADHALETV